MLNMVNKKKVRYLVLTSLVLLFIVYKIAIAETINIWLNNKQIKLELSKLESAPSQIAIYEKKITSLDKLIVANDSAMNNYHGILISEISRLCKLKNVIVKYYPDGHRFKNNNFFIETNYIVLEGEFSDLLILLNKLEIQKKVGHITSVSFEAIPNFKNDSYKLNLTIYVQNIYESEHI